MKSVRNKNSPAKTSLAFRLMLTLVTALSVGLTGCVSLVIHKKTVAKTVQAPNVMNATLDQLNGGLASQYAAIKTMLVKVQVKVATGGSREGEVHEVIPKFGGYMLLRKPSDLGVILQLPLVGSMALEMMADGKSFKLEVPAKNVYREGPEQVTTQSAKGFENLRPNVIRDALLVPPVNENESVSLTQNERIVPPEPGKKVATEEPDYDLTVTRRKSGNELQTIRVIHISRVDLKPYEQDIYDEAGRPVEIVTYTNYQKFGEIDYPTSISISMPIYEYSLHIDVTQATFNQAMDDEQFVLKFPDTAKVTKMP